MAFNVKDAINAAKKLGPNMTEAASGGGYELPAEGFVRLRFVGYYELGQHETEWEGVKKIENQAKLVFELSGPKHQPREHEGQKYPARMSMDVKVSLNEKANFFKMFSAMNYEGKATHIAELLGNDFVGTIVHKKSKDGKKTFANLKDVRKPFVVNPETGDENRIAVDPPLTSLAIYIWDSATPEMWDAIFIPGEYEERKNDKGEVTSPARSKNVIQNKIKSALNFKGSPVFDYAVGKVTAEDAAALDAVVGDAEAVERQADELEGIA